VNPLAPVTGRPIANGLAARRDPTAHLVPNATLVEREDLTPSVARFVVTPDEPVRPFEAGQYFALGIPVGGRLLQRPYSTASSSPASRLEFLVRLVPTGALTPHLWERRPGARLRIGPPKGLFRLTAGDQRAHLFFATGTGLAPLVAMAAALRCRARPPRIAIAHGVAHADELAYRARLESWHDEPAGLVYLPAISRPHEPVNAGWRGLTGRLDGVVPEVLARTAFDPADSVAYLCGNPSMIGAVTRALRNQGLPLDAIVTEQYWTPGTSAAPA
jgi:ferredoxin--NADP+ reductase